MRNAEDAFFSHCCASVRGKLGGAFKLWLCAFPLQKSAARINRLGCLRWRALGKRAGAEQTDECHCAKKSGDARTQPICFKRHLPESPEATICYFLTIASICRTKLL